MKGLLKQLREVDSLPMLPETVRELQRVLVEDSGDATLLMSLIEKDISLSSTVLACANSVLYNYSGRTIIDLREAIVRIGREEIFSMLMTSSLVNVIPMDNNAIDYRSFWVQSLSVASLVRKVKLDSSKEIVSSSPYLYSAGLFHDMGLLVLAIYFSSRIQQVRKLSRENSSDFFEAEFGLNRGETHAAIGATLLEMWKIDTTVTQLVRYHETPLQVAKKLEPLTAILYICSRLVSSQLPNYELRSSKLASASIYELAGLSSDDASTYLCWAEEAIYRAYDTLSHWSSVSLRPIGSSQLFRPV